MSRCDCKTPEKKEKNTDVLCSRRYRNRVAYAPMGPNLHKIDDMLDGEDSKMRYIWGARTSGGCCSDV